MVWRVDDMSLRSIMLIDVDIHLCAQNAFCKDIPCFMLFVWVSGPRTWQISGVLWQPLSNGSACFWLWGCRMSWMPPSWRRLPRRPGRMVVLAPSEILLHLFGRSPTKNMIWISRAHPRNARYLMRVESADQFLLDKPPNRTMSWKRLCEPLRILMETRSPVAKASARRSLRRILWTLHPAKTRTEVRRSTAVVCVEQCE